MGSTTVGVGVDLGGTKAFATRVDADADGNLSAGDTAKVPTPTTGVDDIVDALVAVVAEVDPSPAFVGIGTPGVIAADGRTVEYAPNLAGFGRPVALADRLEERVGAPVVLGNDVNMAALGEVRLGAATGRTDVLAVWMGTGLGAGLVLDGRLRIGPNGLAGELGHVIVVPDGRVCPCGGRGHLEAYIGRLGMERTARTLHEAGRTTELVEQAGDARMKSKVFHAAYTAGDRVAVELVDEGLRMLSIAVANVLVTVDVSTVIVGGGLGERFADIAVPALVDGLAELHYAGTVPDVVPAALGDAAGALGAAAFALEHPPPRSG